MTSSSIGPGTVLSGRYRLDDQLSAHGDARFWRATDLVLARSVAVHAMPSQDPRAARMLEAVRRSVTVTDAHLLRVLDCDELDGVTWAINEWGDGRSLDQLVAHDGLPPRRAAWIAREVAEALAAGHAAGVAHGRLAPERVLVTHAGSVKLIGYALDAAIADPDDPPPPYRDLDQLHRDVIDLAGVLYAGLVGRWPGISPSDVPPAPREAGRPLRPRRVRAGVPRLLDTVCERALGQEPSRHQPPLGSAIEVAAALSDYLGTAPTTQAALAELGSSVFPRTVSAPYAASLGRPGPEDDPEATVAAPPPFPVASELDEEDQGTRVGLADPREQAAPPPPFEQPPDRPLFADEPLRAAEVSAPPWTFDEPAEEPIADDPAPGTPPVPPLGGRHHWLLIAGAVLALVILGTIVAIALAAHHGRGGGTPQSGPRAGGPTSSPTVSLPIIGLKDFDPQGRPPSENPAEVPAADDGNLATAWHTVTYYGNPALGGLKSGVGLRIDLGATKPVGEVTVRLVGSPTSLALYAAPPGQTTPPTTMTGLTQVASKTAAGTTAVLRPSTSLHTRFLVVWLTRLPPAAGGFQGGIAELAVRS